LRNLYGALIEAKGFRGDTGMAIRRVETFYGSVKIIGQSVCFLPIEQEIDFLVPQTVGVESRRITEEFNDSKPKVNEDLGCLCDGTMGKDQGGNSNLHRINF